MAGGIVAPGRMMGKPTGQVGWYALSIRNLPYNFIAVAKDIIDRKPFLGIYRLVDDRAMHGSTIYLYMQSSVDVFKWLKSDEAGAAIVKGLVGFTRNINPEPISSEVMEGVFKRIDPDNYAGKSREVIKKCLRGEGYPSQVRYALDQISRENIKLVEYSSAIIKSLSISQQGTDISWKFSLQMGRLYGLISLNEYYQIRQDQKDISTNNIDILHIFKVADIPTTIPSLAKTGKDAEIDQFVTETIEAEVKRKVNSDLVERVARLLFEYQNKFGADVKNEEQVLEEFDQLMNAPKKPVIEQPTNQITNPATNQVIQPSNLQPTMEKPVMEERLDKALNVIREPIKYKINEYNLSFGYQGIIELHANISFLNGEYTEKPYLIDKQMPGKTLGRILDVSTKQLLIESIRKEFSALSEATMLDKFKAKAEIVEYPPPNFERGGTNSVAHYTLWSINSTALMQANMGVASS